MESGDWATMTTKLDGDKLCFALAHRRGGCVRNCPPAPLARSPAYADICVVCACIDHTYISTHGTTKRGRDQAHKEDCDQQGHCGPARKCPRILNDWTKAQPHIDKANRWRQRTLALEERFRTPSFPFRLQTTVIVGFSIVSAYTMYTYHNNTSGRQFNSFSEFVEGVAFDAMTNTYDADHAAPGASTSTPPPQPMPGVNESLPPAAHVAVSISQIPGWKGSNPARCWNCRAPTSFCCSVCSSADGIVPVHRPEVKHKHTTQSFPCLAKHQRNPTFAPKTTMSHAKAAAAIRRMSRGRGRGE